MLFCQLEQFTEIQNKRKNVWNQYYSSLKPLEEKGWLRLPALPDYATLNGNLFFIMLNSSKERSDLLAYLNKHGIHAVFHYLPLHSSDFFKNKHDERILQNTDRFSDCILRLPFYNEMKGEEIDQVVNTVKSFYN